ncbi:mechanosensitive ion channel family protein [Parvularcula sp. LCG005]|uniref:mechanosensitive ion channel family protein n=1 Tax=Parvularcula sp. LCG005 TaxID=3078805 RepID=UPI002942981F|nr:mechanosensitive ion channel family protein [Parvularcula sp. LCG005]WOI53664.1 mechanosensitive ion channel family protein [Parvularcula sp. LCG005]
MTFIAPCLRHVVTAFLVMALTVVSADAQLLGGQKNNDEAQRPSGFSDLMEAVGSGSRLLIRQIQPGEERDRVENPRYNSQESPRDSLKTFTEAMLLVSRGYDEIGYERALASLPAYATRAQADDLYAVLTRIGPISAAELPGAKRVEQSGDTRFEVFPLAVDHDWIWSAASSPPEGEIALRQVAPKKWLFTQTTLDSLPGLKKSLAAIPPHYDQAQDGQYFMTVFSPLYEQTSLLDWGFFALALVGGLVAGRLFHAGMKYLAGRANEDLTPLLGSTLKGVGRAGGLLIFIFAFTIALGFLTLGPVLKSLSYQIPRFLLVIAVALFILSLIDAASALFRSRIGTGKDTHYDRMVVTIIQRIIRVVILTIILLFVLQNVLGMDVGALLVGLGVFGLALSLAAQDSVKNLFGAITIFANRPFVVGDWIVFKGELGSHIAVVEDIQLQSVKVKDLSGDLITIPNMQFIDKEVQNLSARDYIRTELNIALPYRNAPDEVDRAIQALHDVFEDEEVLDSAKGHDRDGAHISFPKFEDSVLIIRAYYYYFMGEGEDVQRDTDRGWFTYLDHCTLVNRKIMQVFGERDIEFAFPTQTINVVPQAGEPVEVSQVKGRRQSAPA